MAEKKIVQTPDFVNGLLRSADEIDKLLNPELHPRIGAGQVGARRKEVERAIVRRAKGVGQVPGPGCIDGVSCRTGTKNFFGRDKRVSQQHRTIT